MAQQKMTPELLWQLGRVSGEAVSADGKSVLYSVSHYDKDQNKGEKHLFSIPLAGGQPTQLLPEAGNGDIAVAATRTGFSRQGQYWEMNPDGSHAVQQTTVTEGMDNIRRSPDGQYILFSREVKVKKINGKDIYPDLPKTTAQIYDNLNYRHWDTWEDGSFQHVFYATYRDGQIGTPIDLLEGEPFDCPQMPYGGAEDLIWAPDSKSIVYVTKKSFGKDYATSTNTGIYEYNLANKTTKDLAAGLPGYDIAPAFSADGKYIAWLSMAHDGYESDKNDIVVLDRATGKRTNLTKDWDGTVGSIQWSSDGKKIFFVAPIKGTEQLFEIALQKNIAQTNAAHLRQVTNGDFDIAGIVGQSANTLVVSRTDMNHAAELYTLDLKNGRLKQLTTVNDDINKSVGQCRTVKRWITTTDNKQLLAWVIYPPDFDATKKYPTLLYCQGGPQSALTQFYSFRWNFQLIASQGYIVVAPNRRGMPGHGVEWNAAISRDWGGQPIRDYLSAIDDVAKEPYVDKNRLGAVGASYGGYSVYMLAGVHENRFKTFIAHDGLFDLRSWYGTTEELWFANWDIGAYWDPANAANLQKFNPSEYVNKWNTPILIVQGGIDFRVPIEQGQQAFQAAQLKGIKSKLLYFPDENHWVLHPQNALVWQREFFSWLKETL
ncbi:Dipeptidyl aminopeptidase/acylaminoacyl peptidase [Chitinophaga costaii]|uniref:Dipeptidyl aminopeptidase/acylaminoacyl peptidase n=1 Tax=Chitinophaga costaii TaxID=1335309 RepID=A0A1C4AS77_9BACT|nr:S9 family peptidase [Chitinophaga costaii]SCB97560.1 Dipeptidyl aminopeptidase/acylaminoacyl peptidase [Chitinophaga costaii]